MTGSTIIHADLEEAKLWIRAEAPLHKEWTKVETYFRHRGKTYTLSAWVKGGGVAGENAYEAKLKNSTPHGVEKMNRATRRKLGYYRRVGY